jgi:hypothetical protein
MKIEEYIIIDVLFLRVFELQRAREGVLYIYIYIYSSKLAKKRCCVQFSLKPVANLCQEKVLRGIQLLKPLLVIHHLITSRGDEY